MQAGDVESALRIAKAAWSYLVLRGHLVEVIGWLEEGLAVEAPVPVPR